MEKTKSTLFLPAAALLLWSFLLPSLHAGEMFHFEAGYRGLFSAMQTVRIADVRLWVGKIDSHGRRAAQLTVTSAPYGVVENLYPFRLCAKTLFATRQEQPRRTLIYGIENQSADELEEQLLWLHWEKHQIKRLQRKLDHFDATTLHAAITRLSDTKSLLRSLEQGKALDLPVRETFPLPRQTVLDRLSLFLLLRQLEWKPGDRRDFPVAVDDELVRYQLRFIRRERITVDSTTSLARRIEMTELDEGGKAGHVVTFWIGDKAPYLPLKGHSAHPLGDFVIRLIDWKTVDDTEPAGCSAPGFAFLPKSPSSSNEGDNWLF